ncbi:hypothetical protein VP01_221g1 [Puccinia sorghi]|uniref:Uncharacterized protein n=1 Tax=Puccinia sorghi TaxID=27349 RepID=A0A0L6V8N5_9BASI|nr:hypothetical protein VP01_221g1 [Puccinia sorghi]
MLGRTPQLTWVVDIFVAEAKELKVEWWCVLLGVEISNFSKCIIWLHKNNLCPRLITNIIYAELNYLTDTPQGQRRSREDGSFFSTRPAQLAEKRRKELMGLIPWTISALEILQSIQKPEYILPLNSYSLWHYVRTQSTTSIIKIIIAVEFAANKYIKYVYNIIRVTQEKFHMYCSLWEILPIHSISNKVTQDVIVLKHTNSTLGKFPPPTFRVVFPSPHHQPFQHWNFIVAARLPPLTSSQSVQLLFYYSSFKHSSAVTSVFFTCISSKRIIKKFHPTLSLLDSTWHIHWIPQVSYTYKLTDKAMILSSDKTLNIYRKEFTEASWWISFINKEGMSGIFNMQDFGYSGVSLLTDSRPNWPKMRMHLCVPIFLWRANFCMAGPFGSQWNRSWFLIVATVLADRKALLLAVVETSSWACVIHEISVGLKFWGIIEQCTITSLAF